MLALRLLIITVLWLSSAVKGAQGTDEHGAVASPDRYSAATAELIAAQMQRGGPYYTEIK